MMGFVMEDRRSAGGAAGGTDTEIRPPGFECTRGEAGTPTCAAVASRGRRIPAWLAGTTLVEVMIAIVLLGVIAVGGAAFLYRSRADITIARDKRVALEAANSRMEALRLSPYGDIEPSNIGASSCYLSGAPGSWTLSGSDPDETVTINGRAFDMITRAEYRDIDGGVVSDDCLLISVSVQSRLGSDDVVYLESLYAP